MPPIDWVDDRPVLRTRRLVLSPLLEPDADRVALLAGDFAVADTTLNVPHPYPDGAALKWIVTHPDAWLRNRQLTFGICLDGLLVGCVGITPNLEYLRAEIGYWIGRPFWGHGYCTEAASAVVEWGFGTLGLNRILAHHLTRNPASGAVMRKLGMSHEGTLRQHIRKWGRFEDIECMAILREQWQAHRSSPNA